MEIRKFHRDVDIQIQPNKILRSKYKMNGDCNLYQNLVDLWNLPNLWKFVKEMKEDEKKKKMEHYVKYMAESLCLGY